MQKQAKTKPAKFSLIASKCVISPLEVETTSTVPELRALNENNLKARKETKKDLDGFETIFTR